MARVPISCPFSGKVCTECAIYRGRHFYLCSAKRYFGCEWDISLHASIELPNNHGKEEETFQRLTDIPASPRMISDVEDLIEAEEFSRFRLKGEKYDT
jgi:hypothetical protein